ncbi:MAG: cysteine desulfurase family protein [Acidimicrobiales bacterium]
MPHYLDHAATTPIRPAALAALVDVLETDYGNPSGAHRLARRANRILDDARDTVASALGAEPGQIVFTAGGTEADALAVRGVLDASGGVPVCSAVEHHAVLDPVVHAGGRTVAVDARGVLDLDALVAALDPEVSIVSVMLANNETGMIQPVGRVVELVREHAPRALVHTDAVQAVPWLDVATLAAGADLISISAHKFGGPKGTGALVVRPRADPAPLLRGGGQERGRRGGTQNVAGIAAMAVALAETVDERDRTVARVAALRDRLVDGLLAAVPGAVETGERVGKTANIGHLCLPDVASEALLFLLEEADVMASAASSCSSGALDPSHVLAAMGYDRSLAFGSLRLSLGVTSVGADVDAALAAVPAAAARLVGA